MTIFRQGKKGLYTFRRRIPRNLQMDGGPTFFKRGLKTTDRHTAEMRAQKIWAAHLEYLHAVKSGDSEDGREKFDALTKICESFGLPYMPAADLAETASLEDILQRISKAGEAGKPEHRKALLGAAEKPRLALKDLSGAALRNAEVAHANKSAVQQRKVRNNWIRAAAFMCDVLSPEMDATAITEAEAQKIFQAYSDRVMGRGRHTKISKDSAQREWTSCRQIIAFALTKKSAAYSAMMGLSFGDTKVEKIQRREKTKDRPIPEHIINRLLVESNWNGTSPEVLAPLLFMVETGMRPSEICALDAETICLDSNVPHVKIRQVHRELKSASAMRDVPLVGTALEVARLHPTGFKKYFLNEDSWGASAGKYLKAHVLSADEKYTPYGLRHAWSDRAKNSGMGDKMRLQLFGHTDSEVEYGKGASLEVCAEAMTKFAIPVPARLRTHFAT